jgi:hypothetical protein
METSHAALVDIVVEITGYSKIISIISTKNNDILPQGGPKQIIQLTG